MDTATNVLKDISKIPSVCHSYVTKTRDGYGISTVWSQKDFERGVNIKYETTHMVDGNMQWAEQIGCSSGLEDVLLCCPSPSRNCKAVIRQVKQPNGDLKEYLEIWTLSGRKQCIDLRALDKHGKVYEDYRFGCLEWSASGNQILYIAEKYQPVRCSYFESKLQRNKDVLQGEQYEYLEDWGETLEGKHHPVICVMDLGCESVQILENVDKDISPGQACWAPGDKGIVFIGIWHYPYRMGLRFLYNRRSAVFYADFETGKVVSLSADDRHVRCVRFSPDKTKFVYLCNAADGPDWHCSQMLMCDWDSKQNILIVDQVMLPEDSSKFPGIYCINLPDLCWVDDNKRLFMTSYWRSKKEIICVNTDNKKVTRVTNDQCYGSWDILDIHDGIILATRCAPNIPHHLVVGQIPPEDYEHSISWLSLDANPIICDDMMWDILTFQPAPVNGFKVADELDYECVLMKPSISTNEKPPLLVYPHGGPHILYRPEYKIIYDFFCKLGFAVLLVNYRGSLGFGQASILSLPGNIGSSDINDIQDAVTNVLNSGHADPKRVVLMGGSYGGALCLQLISQYPDFYKSCCVRNPVCNLASRLGASDIPDAGLSMACRLERYEPEFLPSIAHYSKLLEKSAIVHVDKVRTPVMFMVGAKDRRIPPQQSLEYHRALRARGVETKLYMYPDVHSLEKIDIEGDRLLNAYKWYAQHM